MNLLFLAHRIPYPPNKGDKIRSWNELRYLAGRHRANNRLAFSGNGYYRHIRTHTFNADLNDESLDQSLYQPTPAEQAALAAAGYSGFPTSGATAHVTSASDPYPPTAIASRVLITVSA